VERLDDYRAEAAAILGQRLKTLSVEEKSQLNKLWRCKNLYRKIPILKNRKPYNYVENFQYPPRLCFDRPSQSFVLA
jgi:hypothetical protein